MNHTSFSRLILVTLLCLLMAGCDEPPPQDLEQGASVIRYMMRPSHLKRSAFSALFNEPKPSQFVSYLFSDMGVVEWPGDAMADPEQMAAIGAPMMPAGVAYFSRQPHLDQGRQIVVSFDDDTGVVIVRGYADPNLAPVMEYQWSLPQTLMPAPGVEAMAQSALQMGASFQEF